MEGPDPTRRHDDEPQEKRKAGEGPIERGPTQPAGDRTEEPTLGRRAESAGVGHEEFVIQVIEHQSRLHAYILSLTLNKERARDILQQTNLVLLEKESHYTPGTAFFAWAAKVAYYEVLAERRRNQRDRHLFSDELLAAIASTSLSVNETLEQRAEALKGCLDRVPEPNREVLMRRYRPGGSVTEIAESLGKTPGAVSALLHRLRATLVECVERRLKSQSHA